MQELKMPGAMYRLSPQQKRLFEMQNGDGDSGYRAQTAILITGELDAKLLEAAIQRVIARNGSLRTTFVTPDGLTLPVQFVSEAAGPVCEHISLLHIEPQWQGQEVDRLFKQEMGKPPAPSRNSLLRASLIALAADKHILLVSLPALCADARTLDNLLAEITLCYADCVKGEQSDGEAAPYVQFSEWQNELLEEEDAAEGKEFWQNRLAASAVSPVLPFGKTPATDTTFEPEILAQAIDRELATTIRELAQQCGVEVDLVMLACWQTLLWRLTEQSEMFLGVMCDGRKFEELNDCLGLYAKWLPLSVQLRRGLSFGEVVKQAEQQVGEALDWQEYFIWEAGQGVTNSYPEIGFEYERRSAERSVGGLSFSIYKQHSCVDRCYLKLLLVESSDSLVVEFHYDPARFESSEVGRLATEFLTLAASAATDAGAEISKLRILDESQRRQVLYEFNSTQADYPQGVSLHGLFERQAELTPDGAALAFEEGQLTYAELNRRANQLAHYLRGLDVGPETLVGICIGRSADMVIGVLGTLKAGAAYLPLDPEYPKDRLRFMIEDAQVTTLLTQIHLAANLPDSVPNIVYLDTDWGMIALESDQNPAVEADPDNLAYVIYTSGSTGKPKGAMNSHHGVCNRQLWMQHVYALTPGDSVLQLSSFSFDFSVWEILGTLATGAKLVLVRPGGQKDTAYLRTLIAEEGVTVIHFVPSMLQAFLEESGLETCESVRRVFCGGEALSFELQERFFSRFNSELHNQYGPTEASIDVTFWDCIQGDAAGVVPIGQPNGNNTLNILDGEGEPTPIGVSGELYIGGIAVGRGYLNRPELTAERFIPDPFTSRRGARLYKTGDLARYRPDGNIDYLGRIDEQVKVRGFRIELGEVEAALNSHPQVREAVVVAQEAPAGDKRLAAFVVCSQKQAVSGAELSGYVAEMLPDYMVPSQIVVIDSMPLTASGKVDRKALSGMEIVTERAEQREPRNVIEEMLAGIWEEVLGIEGVGVEDNFFEVGGHSLLATQMASRVREAFAIDLELRVLFDSPQLAQLAAIVEEQIRAREAVQAPPIRPVPRGGPLPLSYAQARLWFIDQMQPGSPLYNVPMAARVVGELSVWALWQGLEEIVRRHESLRTVFRSRGGKAEQEVKPEWGQGVKVIDLSGLGAEEREAEGLRIGRAEGRRGFELERGPLVRGGMVKVSEEEQVVMLTMHHIISDGWSMNLLIGELARLYTAYREGAPSPLEELEVQYADYSEWQRELLQGEVLESQMRYWKEHLSGVGVLELPTDRLRPAVQTYAGDEINLFIDAETTDRLRELSRRESATLFMVMLAIFKVLLHRYSGQEEIVVGTPMAGRNRKEVESLIGVFINMLVLRSQVKATSSYVDVLKGVREVTLGAYTHQEAPFEKLVEELHPERDLSRSPLFQVLFSFQPPLQVKRDLPGIELKVEELSNGVAKYDLTLDFVDTQHGTFGTLGYNSDLFDHATAARMVQCFQTLLASIVERPDEQIALLPLLTEAEREEILVEWNQTAADYPHDRCVHELFEEQARRTPERVAVVSDSSHLTFAELNRRADRLARRLTRLGVGPDVRVGVCLERSLEMVVGLLGVLKAGGAYVPVDPGYPAERVRMMIEDAGVAAVVSKGEEASEALSGYEGEVVRVEESWGRAGEEEARGREVGGGHLAYVIYTSGSTGRPKGVMIEHSSVVNFLYSMREHPGLCDSDVLLAVTSISFDIAALEMYLPLIAGAKLVIASQQTASDGEALARELAESQASVMQATPITWRLLIEAGWKNETSMKVLSGGEHLPSHLGWALVDRTHSLWNLYGPTETTIWSATVQVESKPAVIPIGRPIANTQIYILNSHLEPAPVGVAGDLYIGGDGLARGYHQSPDLTAEKFIPDPFRTGRPGRLYKTGDWARYLPDGNVEFMGRGDQQVKLRGYRIEIGEIETALALHPDVRACVVSVFEEPGADKRLVAYLLSSADQAPSFDSLRQFLKGRLPDYMLPSNFVLLEEFPQTPNGKIDRKALPAPERVKARADEAFDGPLSSTVGSEAWNSRDLKSRPH